MRDRPHPFRCLVNIDLAPENKFLASCNRTRVSTFPYIEPSNDDDPDAAPWLHQAKRNRLDD